MYKIRHVIRGQNSDKVTNVNMSSVKINISNRKSVWLKGKKNLLHCVHILSVKECRRSPEGSL